MCIYIYTYIYVYTYVHRYIYVECHANGVERFFFLFVNFCEVEVAP